MAPSRSDPSTLPLAGLLRRLVAIGYDCLLLAGLLFVATALALGLMAILVGDPAAQANNALSGNPFFRTYLLLVCFFFYGGFWVYGGQTLGMRAWRLRVCRRDGQGIDWWRALLRFLVAGLWLVPMIYLHQVFKLEIGLSLGAGFACLLLLLALRVPDRISETDLVVLPKLKAPRK
ncbi:MAG: RDD family protein [Phycisphaerales bacterium]|nr:RDD family protein [Phycisphaerales bacterium]